MTAGLLAATALAAPAAATSGPDDRSSRDRRAAGFVNPAVWRARQDGYLRFATEEISEGSPLNVIAHLERDRRDRRYRFDASAITPDDFAPLFADIDTWQDTSDFDLLYLMNLWYGYRRDLTPELRAAIEQRFLGFEYWYTEPTPAGVVDQKWYWSENHRIIFHTLEYLAGQAFPTATFRDGRTGAEHRAHAERLIGEWLVEKARYGFSEWHSDVYYQKDVTPLLTLVEFADDRALAERAGALLDVVLLDLALHGHDGNLGATHGRSYMKDKSRAADQDVFGLMKLLFATTDQPYTSRGDAGAVLLGRAQRYRLPEVVLRIARDDRPMVDRERMGVPLDPDAPIEPDPAAPYGYDFDDPENVDFWWERGALPTWQGVGLTLATADEYDLWDTDFFEPFVPLRDLTGGSVTVARALAKQLQAMLGFALLSEVDTYTYRTGDVMLSSAQDYRPGFFGEQHHAWQATLDEDAIVFTTHPKHEPQVGTRWPDSDGYWTGSGSLPRTAQHGAAAIHLYAPQFANPAGTILDTFAYLDRTHAYFPQERFDEVVQEGGWTFGRKGRGYVALWSWRPVEWKAWDPADGYFTNGLTEPFDLVAEGGADNVWISEVGDGRRWGSFEAFRAAVAGAPVDVVERSDVNGLPGGFDVRYASPTSGTMEFGWTGPLRVGGAEVDLHGSPRFDNPYTRVEHLAEQVEVRAGNAWLRLDLAAGTREVGRGRTR